MRNGPGRCARRRCSRLGFCKSSGKAGVLAFELPDFLFQVTYPFFELMSGRKMNVQSVTLGYPAVNSWRRVTYDLCWPLLGPIIVYAWHFRLDALIASRSIGVASGAEQSPNFLAQLSTAIKRPAADTYFDLRLRHPRHAKPRLRPPVGNSRAGCWCTCELGPGPSSDPARGIVFWL